MLQVARLYVPTRAVAEEVVQEAWLGVLNGIARFEGRSSFKTWLFRILTNTAQTRAARERRSVPFSSLAQAELETGETSVDPDRFIPQGERWASHWATSPRRASGVFARSRRIAARERDISQTSQAACRT